MKTEKWFRDKTDKFRDDVEFQTEEAILELNERIAQIMEEKGINRAKFANLLGVSKAFITKLLNGNPNLTIKSMVSIANALGCELDIDICPKGFEVRKFYVSPSPKKMDVSEFTEDVFVSIGGETNAVAA